MNYFSSKKIKAFSLIELLVAISVLSLIAALSLTSYPKFSEQITVSTEVYKMLGYMKEAQVYGVSAYTEPGVKVVYGVEISKANRSIKRVGWQNPTGTKNADYVNNKSDTSEEVLTLGDKFEFDKICSTDTCTDDFDTAFLFFKRPNPDARILGRVGTVLYPNTDTSTGFQKLFVHIKSKRNAQFVKKIVILQTGQMYVSDW